MNSLLKHLLFISFLFSSLIAQAQYCDVSGHSTAPFAHFTRVRINTLDQTTGNTGYGYYPDAITDLLKDSTYTIRVNTASNGSATRHISAWIDMNRNNSFESGERFNIGTCGAANCMVTGTITIPSTAANGVTRMRLVMLYNNGQYPDDPCDADFTEEIEDYDVSICTGKMNFLETKPAHPTLVNIVPGTTDNEILQVKVRTEGCVDPFRARKFIFRSTVTDTADIASARLFYTYKSGIFKKTVQIDTTILKPGRTLVFNDALASRTLLSDTNYYWLAFDIETGATEGNYVDAELEGIVINDTLRAPAISAPPGKRLISDAIFYYSKLSGNVNNKATWGSNIDGTGVEPPNFTNDNTIYIVRDSASLGSNGAWTVNGTNSKVVIQGGGTVTKASGNNLTFPLELQAEGTLILAGANNNIAPLRLDSLSTVIYKDAGGFKPLWTYGNLTLDATANTSFSMSTSNLNVKNNLHIRNGVFSLHTGGVGSSNNVTDKIGNNLIIETTGTLQAANGTGSQGTVFLTVGNSLIMNSNAKLYGNSSSNTVNAFYTIGKNMLMNGTFIGTAGAGSFRLDVGDTLLINSGKFIGADSTCTSQSSHIITVKDMFVKGGTAVLSKVNGSAGIVDITVRGSLETTAPGTFYMYNAAAPRTNYTGKIAFTSPSGSSVVPGNLSVTPSADDVRGGQINVIVQNKREVTLKSDVNLGIDKTFTVDGTLITGTYKVKNASANTSGSKFILNDNATLDIGSVDGITATGATGSVQTVTRTFSVNANYKYSGTAPQVTGDGIPVTVKGLIANNTKYVRTSKKVTVNTLLGFTSTPAFLLTDTLVLGTAAATSGNGAKQFVMGKTIKKFSGTTSFLIPTGDTAQGGFYMPVAIAPKASGTDYLAQFIYKNPTTDGYNTAQKEAGLGNISDKSYHKVERRAGTGNADLTIIYNQSDAGIVNENQLVLARWNVPTAAKWNLNTTTVDKANNLLSISDQAFAAAGIYAIAGKQNSGNYGEPVPPIAGFTADKLTGCSGVSIAFMDTSLNATSWTWNFPGGNPSTSNLQNPVVTYNTAGDYNVTLTAGNAFGTDVEAKTSFINVTNCTKPDAAFGTDSPKEGCASLTVQFKDLSVNAVSWNWTFTGGMPATSTDQHPTIVYQTPGQYTVRLIATNQSGSDTILQTNYVNVLDCTAPTAAFTSDTTQGCEGRTIYFYDQSTNATSWSWTFPGGTPSSSTSQNPVITYNAAGNYKVTLVAVNAYGNTTLNKDNYISIKLCMAPAAGFTANRNAICRDSTVTFADTSKNAIAWEWTFEGGVPATSTDQNPVVTYPTPGVYDVTLKAINNNGNDTKVMNDYITVNNCAGTMPAANFSYVVIADSVKFTNLSTNAVSYLWKFGDATTSTAVSPTHGYASSGTYTVCLKATNPNGSDSTCTNITVTVGIEEQLISNMISVYPNPAKDQLFITLPDNFALLEYVELIDARGRIIFVGKDTKIDISDLNNGLYIIRVRTDKGIGIRKVQVLR